MKITVHDERDDRKLVFEADEELSNVLNALAEFLHAMTKLAERSAEEEK